MNKLGSGANLTGTLDVVANSLSVIQNGQVVDISDLFVHNASVGSVVAPITSPNFQGTISGITKTMIGLANVDNTADLAKPISTATQAALNLKAPLASPTFTGTVNGITK